MGIPLKKRHWPVEVGLLLGLLILVLFCFQYTTIAKFGVLLPGLSYQTLPNFMDEVNERIDFDLVDPEFGSYAVQCRRDSKPV